MAEWRLLTTEETISKDKFGFLYGTNGWLNYECSKCGYLIHNSLKGSENYRTPFCPMCGARMDGNRRNKMTDIGTKIKVTVVTDGLDEALEKAKELREILREIGVKAEITSEDNE